MAYLPLAIFVAAIAALDQVTKLLVVRQIAYGTTVPCLQGVFHLTYVQNYGAAFSFLQGQRWLFVLAFLVFVGVIVVGIRKRMLPFTRVEQWFLAATVGGGLGNLIDRLFRGYVVDMIAVDFIRFPVFNVADCFITCGAALLLVHLVCFNRDFWREGKRS